MKQRLQVETSSARPPAGCGRWVPLSHPDSRARPNPPQIRPNFCTLRAGRVPKPDEQRVSDPCACQAKAESCKFFFLSVFQGVLVLLLHFKAGCSLLFGVISSAVEQGALLCCSPHAEGRWPWSFPQTRSLVLLRAPTGCTAWGPAGTVLWGCSSCWATHGAGKKARNKGMQILEGEAL